jgi:menaquinone-dependent protoporphyrinogen oxidase
MSGTIAIIYSSWHGHTRSIAEHMAGVAQAHGVTAEVVDVRRARRVLDGVNGAIIAGSVHFGRHHRPLQRFIVRNRMRLSTMPTAFVSVSGAAASLDGRVKAAGYASELLAATGWQPDHQIVVGGAVLYTHYDPLTRLAMKFASRFAGRGTDTSKDYVYTEWFVVDEFVSSFLGTLDRAAQVSVQL